MLIDVDLGPNLSVSGALAAILWLIAIRREAEEIGFRRFLKTFHFVSEGPEAALKQAREGAEDQDVRIGGGVATIRQHLMAAQIEEMHLAFSPVLLGEGQNLFAGIHLPKFRFKPVQTTAGDEATHVVLKRT